MHWNGYSGRVGGVGGSAACDGAILLQCGQLALVGPILPGGKATGCDVFLWWH